MFLKDSMSLWPGQRFPPLSAEGEKSIAMYRRSKIIFFRTLTFLYLKTHALCYRNKVSMILGQLFSQATISKENLKNEIKKIFFVFSSLKCFYSKQLFATISSDTKINLENVHCERRMKEKETCSVLWYGQTMRSGNPEKHEILCLNVCDSLKAPNERKDAEGDAVVVLRDSCEFKKLIDRLKLLML